MKALAGILYLIGPTCFVLLVCMAFAGWFGLFRIRDQRDAIAAEKVELEKDFEEVCKQLNELRASVAGGWPITF